MFEAKSIVDPLFSKMLWQGYDRGDDCQMLKISTIQPIGLLLSSPSSSCKCKLWFSTAFLKLHIGRKIKHKSELGRRRNRCEAKTAWRSCNTALGAHPAICNPWSTSFHHPSFHPSILSAFHPPSTLPFIHLPSIHLPSIRPSIHLCTILQSSLHLARGITFKLRLPDNI